MGVKEKNAGVWIQPRLNPGCGVSHTSHLIFPSLGFLSSEMRIMLSISVGSWKDLIK